MGLDEEELEMDDYAPSIATTQQEEPQPRKENY